ncbi:hypothetical protein OB905_13615 [Halobacteria archaeon AArc-dxtr1]|nr:hypothetical protein [Halobacteria archaeon AArc-dxtr1]
MSKQTTVSADRTPSRGASIAASGGLGVLAAAIGYLVAYVAVADEARELGSDIPEWMGVAWYYYNAHMVDLEVSGQLGGISGTDSVDLIAESGSTSAELLYVVPPLVLIGIGAIAAYQLDARDLGEGVIAGAPIAVGYAVVLGIGAVVAEASGESSFFGFNMSGSMAPELVPAVFLGGVLYPLVFATAGAVLVAVIRAP